MASFNYRITFNESTNTYNVSQSPDSKRQDKNEIKALCHKAWQDHTLISFKKLDGRVEEVQLNSENEYFLFLSRLGIYERKGGVPPPNLPELGEDNLRAILSFLSPEERSKAGSLSTEERSKVSKESLRQLALQEAFDAEIIHALNSKKPVRDLFLKEDQLIDLLKRKGGQIEHLDLECFPLQDPKELIRNLPNLKSLSLICSQRVGQIGAEEAEALANSPFLKGLTSLDLSGNRIGNEGAWALANSPHFKGLISLVLKSNAIGVEGAKALANSKNFEGLTSLNLGYNTIGVEGVNAFANSPHLEGLTSLDLNNNHIGVEGAKALANSPYLKGLTSLDLLNNSIGDEGAKALANSPHLEGLTSLDLRLNNLGDEGAKALANSPRLEGLTSLNLRYNHIGDEGANALANSPHLEGLTLLDLSGNNIGDEGERIAASRNLKKIVMFV